ncbi:unnamed protein product [Rotaria sp. Silwood2]|nr:unnamed protein product [Rotaria sp. Silwood2]CAF2994418.1 unnamed protein product [Rotaria sp. Silwood2]CAF3219379.1 unnamed protein product [Rotaria sp. Silwood2]CAF4098338.1 unnamed protein product [Rotaria sp. Silwood2]
MIPPFMFFTWTFIAATPDFRCRLPYETDDYNAEMNELFTRTYKPTEEDCTTYQQGISLKECQQCYARVFMRNTSLISNLQTCNNYVFDQSIYKKTLVEEVSHSIFCNAK